MLRHYKNAILLIESNQKFETKLVNGGPFQVWKRFISNISFLEISSSFVIMIFQYFYLNFHKCFKSDILNRCHIPNCLVFKKKDKFQESYISSTLLIFNIPSCVFLFAKMIKLFSRASWVVVVERSVVFCAHLCATRPISASSGPCPQPILRNISSNSRLLFAFLSLKKRLFFS